MSSPFCIPYKSNSFITTRKLQSRKSMVESSSIDYSSFRTTETLNKSSSNNKQKVCFNNPSNSKMNLTFSSSSSSLDVFQFRSKDNSKERKSNNPKASEIEARNRIPLFKKNITPHFTSPNIRKPLKNINNECSPRTPPNLPFKLPANGTPITPAMERLMRDYNSPSASQRARALNALRSGVPLEEDSSDDEIAQLRAQLPKRAERLEDVLKGVIAYVEVRTGEDNRSYGIKAVLRDMGATVLDRFLKDVTHVVFKEGLMSTYKKAKSRNVHLVSVLWIEASRINMYKVHETLYPATDLEVYESPHGRIRRVKSMQPDYEGINSSKSKKKIKKKTINEPADHISSASLEESISEPVVIRKKLADSPTERYLEILRQLGGSDLQKYSEETPPYPSSISDGSENDKLQPLAVRLMKQFMSTQNPIKSKSADLPDEQPGALENIASPVNDKHNNVPIPNESTKNVETSCKQPIKKPSIDSDSFVSVDYFTDPLEPVHKKHKRNTFQNAAEVTSNSENFANNSSKETQINKPSRSSRKSKTESNTSTNMDSESLHLYLSVSEESNTSGSTGSFLGGNKHVINLLSKSSSIGSSSLDNLGEGYVESPKPARRNSVRLSSLQSEKLLNSQEKSMTVNKNTPKEKHSRTSRKSLFNSPFKKYTHVLNEVVEMECDVARDKIPATEEIPTNAEKDTANICNDRNSSKSNEANSMENSSSASAFVTPDRPKNSNIRNSTTRNRRASVLNINNETVRSSDAFTTPDRRTNRRKSFLISASKTKLIIDELESLSLDGSIERKTKNNSNINNMQDHNTTTSNINKSVQVKGTSKKTERRKTMFDYTCKITNTEEDSRSHNSKNTSATCDASINKENTNADNIFAPTNGTKRTYRKLCNVDDDFLDDIDFDKTSAPILCPYFSTIKENNNNIKKRNLKRKREDSNINNTITEICQPKNVQTEQKITNSNETSNTFDSLPISLLNNLSHIKPARRSSLEFVKKHSRESLVRLQTQKPKPKVKLQTIVRTSLHGADISYFELVVKELGKFVLSDSVIESTTHVVSAEPRRTLNILKGIARGCWILNMDWVKKSKEAGKWLDEDDFEWVSFSPAVQRARIERLSFESSFKMDVFSTCGAIYVSRNSIPSSKDLEELIKLGCGKIVSNYRIAQIVVGEQLRHSDIRCVSEKWVLDCIELYKYKGLDKYVLE